MKSKRACTNGHKRRDRSQKRPSSEVGSARSGSHASRILLVSSHAIRAHARGEAAAALKKAEVQRKINEFRSKSALALEELEEKKRRDEELAFEQKKREEEACL